MYFAVIGLFGVMEIVLAPRVLLAAATAVSLDTVSAMVAKGIYFWCWCGACRVVKTVPGSTAV